MSVAARVFAGCVRSLKGWLLVAEVKVRVSRQLVDVQSLLGESVLLVGQAVRNLQGWSVSGLPSSTPGNGSPGGGKGGGRTMKVDGERVPVTSVEASVLEAEPDVALDMLAELAAQAVRAAQAGSDVLEQFSGDRPLAPDVDASTMQFVVHGFRCARLLVELFEVPDGWSPVGGWPRWSRPSRRVWELTQRYGHPPAEPKKGTTTDKRALLAVDLTGNWCVSCLRAGKREPRDRHDHNSEFCSWCRKFTSAEGFVPPMEICQARADGKRITEPMIAPHRQAYRDQQTAEAQRARRKGGDQ